MFEKSIELNVSGREEKEINDTFKKMKAVNIYDIRLRSALLSKPFVILTGLSGSGKTRLAESFSRWLCGKDSDQVCLVSVGSDWSSNEKLLGYPNALKDSEYVMPDTGVLKLLIHANENVGAPHFLILDEMNLSHVERYFSDFLSAMEMADGRIKLYDGADRQNGELKIPKEIAWPKNLFVIGTVNVDETTYMFSPKVLDRAQVIEFRISENEMISYLDKSGGEVDFAGQDGQGKGQAEEFLNLAKQIQNAPMHEAPEAARNALKEFFPALAEIGAEFGYRTANDFGRFVGAYLQIVDAEDKESKAIDFAIMQKLLPKLHGSRRKLRKPLEELWRLCLGDQDGVSLSSRDKPDFAAKFKYPVSAEKIWRMNRALEENGFASYAEA